MKRHSPKKRIMKGGKVCNEIVIKFPSEDKELCIKKNVLNKSNVIKRMFEDLGESKYIELPNVTSENMLLISEAIESDYNNLNNLNLTNLIDLIRIADYLEMPILFDKATDAIIKNLKYRIGITDDINYSDDIHHQVDTLLGNLQNHIISVIYLKLFKNFASTCLDNINNEFYSRYCYMIDDYKELFSKNGLTEYGYIRGLKNWDGKYYYILGKILKMRQLIRQYSSRVLPLIITRSILIDSIDRGIMSNFTEEEMNEFSDDVLDFILRQKPKVRKCDDIQERILEERDDGNIISLQEIFEHEFVPQNIRNSLIEMVIEKYNRDGAPSLKYDGEIFYNSDNSVNMDITILNILLENGSNRFVAIKNLVKYGNVDLIIFFSKRQDKSFYRNIILYAYKESNLHNPSILSSLERKYSISISSKKNIS